MTNEIHYIKAGWRIDGVGEPVQENVLLTLKSGTILNISHFNSDDFPDPSLITDLSHGHHPASSGSQPCASGTFLICQPCYQKASAVSVLQRAETLDCRTYPFSFSQHIPQKSFQLVRYYGWHSNRMRGEWRKLEEVNSGEEQEKDVNNRGREQ